MSKYIKFLVVLSFVELSQEIIGGTPTTLLRWPSYVLLKFRSNHYCGGSMFHPHWVITAAQCVDHNYIDTKKIEGLGLGISNLDKQSTGKFILYELLFIAEYPAYTIDRSGVPVHDIALIRIPNSIPLTPTSHDVPISKSVQETVLRRKCHTAGFGMSNVEVFDREIDIRKAFRHERTIYEVEQIIVPFNECMVIIENQLRFKVELDEANHLCARGAKQRTGPTFGDIGGPLICSGTQVGIYSISCYAPEVSSYLYTIYTRIENYRSWIESQVTNNPELEPPKPPAYFRRADKDKQRERHKHDQLWYTRTEKTDMHRNVELSSNLKSLREMYQARVDNLDNCVSKLHHDMNFIFVLIFIILLQPSNRNIFL